MGMKMISQRDDSAFLRTVIFQYDCFCCCHITHDSCGVCVWRGLLSGAFHCFSMRRDQIGLGMVSANDTALLNRLGRDS